MDIDDEQQVIDISNYVVDLRNSSFCDSTDNYVQNSPSPNMNQQRIAYLVIDTNFILSHLRLLTDLEKLLHIKYNGIYQIVIPKQVIHELDGLKESKGAIESNHSIATLARNSINWCYSHFHDSIPTVTGQRLHERIDRNAVNDDAILDCCLYFQNIENGGTNLVILLSDDKNLCVKSLVNNILTVSYRPGMTAELIAENVVNELNANYGYTKRTLQMPEQYECNPTSEMHTYDDSEMQIEDSNLQKQQQQDRLTKDTRVAASGGLETAIEVIYSQITTLVLESISYAIKYIYEDETDLIDYKESEIKTLQDAGKFIIRYSFSIFGDFFPSRNSPIKLLEGNFGKYTKVPYPNISEVKEFIAFWSDILDGIYQNRSNEQKSALVQIKANWNKLIANI